MYIWKLNLNNINIHQQELTEKSYKCLKNCFLDLLQKSHAHVSARKARATAASGLASCPSTAPKVVAAFTAASSLNWSGKSQTLPSWCPHTSSPSTSWPSGWKIRPPEMGDRPRLPVQRTRSCASPRTASRRSETKKVKLKSWSLNGNNAIKSVAN